jgi:uncharacterized membrane protein
MFKSWDSCLNEAGVPTLGCIPIVFNNIISAALTFVGVVALFLIIWAGFNMITSGGDPKKVEGAKKIMTYAIIGLVIVLLSFSIIFFIGYTTGTTDCITGFTDAGRFLTGCN